MPIETVEDLAEALADAIGVWGSCPDSERPSCTQTGWCRLCWTQDVKRRMRDAVHTEDRLAREKEGA